MLSSVRQHFESVPITQKTNMKTLCHPFTIQTDLKLDLFYWVQHWLEASTVSHPHLKSELYPACPAGKI